MPQNASISPRATPPNPWIVAVTVTLATFMELLDTSIANVSQPTIAAGLGRSIDDVTWILTTYLVANAVILPISAWLSRVFGRKAYYMTCVALFTLTSFVCGIAPTLPILLVARILQGIGGGGLAPVEQAILVDTFPPRQRASAFALYTIAIVTAPAIGPVLGGWITDNFSWRWVFFINIPVGLLSLFLTRRFVHDPPSFQLERQTVRDSRGRLQVDGIGIGLIAIGSAALELLLDRGQIEDWFGSRLICWLFAAAVLSLGAAVIWEWHHPDPVIDFRLLRKRNFAIANLFYFLFGFGLFSSTTILPQMLEILFGYRALNAGLVLGPGAFAITLLAPVGAVLVQRNIVQPRPLLFLAVLAIGFSFLYTSRLTLDSDFFHFTIARVLTGIGYGFFFVPLSVIAYSQLTPAENNRASSFTNFFRNWGGSFGVAFVTTLSERRQSFHQARSVDIQTLSSGVLTNSIRALANYLQAAGFSRADSLRAATARIYQGLIAQTQFLAYMDCFVAVGAITLLLAPLVLVAANLRGDGGDIAPH